MVYQILAIVLLAGFYGTYFWKMFQQHKQGIQTDQLGKGKEGFVRCVEIGTKGTAIAIVIVQLISIVLNLHQENAILRLLGLLLGTAGLLVFVTAVLTMKDNWRAGVSKTDETELVTDGIYAWSRNPAFLGFDLLDTGILLMFWNVPLLVVTVCMLMMYHLQIVNVEEDFLVEHFKDSYIQYRKKTCRYFGKKNA